MRIFSRIRVRLAVVAAVGLSLLHGAIGFGHYVFRANLTSTYFISVLDALPWALIVNFAIWALWLLPPYGTISPPTVVAYLYDEEIASRGAGWRARFKALRASATVATVLPVLVVELLICYAVFIEGDSPRDRGANIGLALLLMTLALHLPTLPLWLLPPYPWQQKN